MKARWGGEVRFEVTQPRLTPRQKILCLVPATIAVPISNAAPPIAPCQTPETPVPVAQRPGRRPDSSNSVTARPRLAPAPCIHTHPVQYCRLHPLQGIPQPPSWPRAPVTVSVSGRNETLSASTVLDRLFQTVSGGLLVLFCAASGKTRLVLDAVACPSVRDVMGPRVSSWGPFGFANLDVENGEVGCWSTALEFCSYRHVIVSLGAAAAEPRSGRHSAPWGRCCPDSRGEPGRHLGRVDARG